MIKLDATGTVDYLEEGQSWPFPSDAFPINRRKSRNKKFRKGDRFSFQAIELKGDLRAWKIIKSESPD